MAAPALTPAMLITSHGTLTRHDSLVDAIGEARRWLLSTYDGGPSTGDWAVILGRDGRLRRRYRLTARGTVAEVERG